MGSCTTTFDKTTTRGKQLVITCTKYYCTMPTRKVYIMKENSVAVNRAKRSVGDKPYALWGGGSATIVSPTEENNGDIILAELQCVPSVVGSRVMNINNVKVVNPSNNKRKREEDPLLDPEEEEKRRMRRDRNRLAAAKCRKSRTGLTPTSILTPIKTTSNLNTPTYGSQHKTSIIFTPQFSPNTEATLLTSL